jgi:alpha-galactosidase
MKVNAATHDTSPEDMQLRRNWTDRFFSKPSDLPISFSLDGKPLAGIPEAWRPVVRRRRIDANIVETVFEGREAQSGLSLRVECVEYADYPVIEWTAWLTHDGKQPAPIVSDLQALDTTFAGASPVVYHGNGDFGSVEGYTPQKTLLGTGDVLRFAPSGGRACDGAFPYYRIGFEGWGVSLAIGWPTQWAVQFEGRVDGIQIRAGQEKTNLRLLPGESIRTPRMTVLTWSGDGTRAVNLWRRWYLAHILPRPDGQPLKPLLACAATDEGEEFTAATEENQIRYIGKFKERGI